jgi:hypothetical protein
MKNGLALLFAALSAYLFQGSESFRLGSFKITVATVAGKPAHLSFAQVLQAAKAAYSGTSGPLQVGDVTVTISTWP